jgi:hypothetical protein
MTKEPEGFAELAPIVGDQSARDIIAYRRKIKKPLTERAARAVANELAKVPQPRREEAIDHWLNKAWQGFKAEWFMEPQGHIGRSKPVSLGGSPKTFSDEFAPVKRGKLPDNHFLNQWKQ